MRWLLLLASALWVGAACAGDVAELEILGFSANGNVFAFEEYGVQDGSGFPYSNRYYVDTTTDSFLPGTPIRVRLEADGDTLEKARQQSRQRGEAVLSEKELSANRGYTAGLNPVTELSADPFRMVVNPRPVFHPVDPPLEFRLEEFSLNDAPACAGLGEIKGFRLIRVDSRDGGRTQLINDDKSIPKSRHCPSGYSIGGVQTFSVKEGLVAYAVMIAVRQYGFEGPDYRWLAVTGRF